MSAQSGQPRVNIHAKPGMSAAMGYPMRYQLMDHTADGGLIVSGKTLSGVYRRAALALFDLMVDMEADPAGFESVDITVDGADREDLLVNWLREVLFLWNGHEKLVTDIFIHRISRHRITAAVQCVDFDPEQHHIKKEIKAVTYHRTAVTRTTGGWRAEFIFDL